MCVMLGKNVRQKQFLHITSCRLIFQKLGCKVIKI
jgi:hypothetical protein